MNNNRLRLNSQSYSLHGHIGPQVQDNEYEIIATAFESTTSRFQANSLEFLHAEIRLHANDACKSRFQTCIFPKDANILARKIPFVHSDVCGQMTPSVGVISIFFHISMMLPHTLVYPLKEKSHVFKGFREFLFLAESLGSHKLISLHTNREGECMTRVQWFLKGIGIICQYHSVHSITQ